MDQVARRGDRLEGAVIAIVAVIGAAVCAGPISSNTLFVHLRTGIDMVERGAIWRHDPYSFTATGAGWTDQSWLVEWTYGLLYRVGGTRAVIYEHMLLAGVLALVVMLLLQTGSVRRTVPVAVVVLALAVPMWSPRPQLLALLAFALLVLVVERGRSPWLLPPIAWVWVNSHGSYPLGLGWLVLVTVGASVGSRAVDRKMLRYVVAFLGGLVLAMCNPLGPRLLAFPFTVLASHRASFANIVEWGSPDFNDPVGMLQLAAVAVIVLVMVRARSSWRTALAGVAFLAAGLLAMRNLPFASLALVPAMAEAARLRKPADVEPDTSPTPVVAGSYAVAIIALVVMLARVSVSAPFDLDGYPVGAVAWMDRQGLLDAPHHVAAQDVVGCYRILRDGAKRKVFIDDRYDMYPSRVAADYIHLLRLDGDPNLLLGRYDIDVVLWDKTQPLEHVLATAPGWQQRYVDEKWVVFTRTSTG